MTFRLDPIPDITAGTAMIRNISLFPPFSFNLSELRNNLNRQALMQDGF